MNASKYCGSVLKNDFVVLVVVVVVVVVVLLVADELLSLKNRLVYLQIIFQFCVKIN